MIDGLKNILNTFESEEYKKTAELVIENAPVYWSHVPASSSGKYHPQYALGDGGLLRHTMALIRFLNFMFEVESVASQFTSRERDLLRIAGLAHDMWKSGVQEDYEKSKWTRFDHPLIAAEKIVEMNEMPEDDKIFIRNVISTHMGQWNKDKRYPDIILPKPKDKYQIILHLADYLASRKDIDMKFDDLPESESEETPDISTWKFPWGKHKGMTIPEVAKEDPGYIRWAKEKMENEPARTLLKDFVI